MSGLTLKLKIEIDFRNVDAIAKIIAPEAFLHLDDLTPTERVIWNKLSERRRTEAKAKALKIADYLSDISREQAKNLRLRKKT